MFRRRVSGQIRVALSRQAAVGLLGPRQAGKTTLARAVAEEVGGVVVDLELSEDRARVADLPRFLRANEERLVVFDEIHRLPEVFAELRGSIDDGRRRGLGTGRFLALGSASMQWLRQSESLAGRIEYLDLNPLDVGEVESVAGTPAGTVDRLWLRGGRPPSFLANSDEDSVAFRRNLIREYLENEVPRFRPGLSAPTLERLWSKLARHQGRLLNAAKLAASLARSAPTVLAYLDLLEGLFLLRRLPPRHLEVKKRLVKSPRLYVRDPGLLHALLGIRDRNGLLGHPVVGASWEGFVIETLLGAAPPGTLAGFYRTGQGAEADLVLDLPGRPRPWAIEVQRTSAPRRTRSFTVACQDLEPERAFVVHGGEHRFPLGPGQEAIGLPEMAELLRAL